MPPLPPANTPTRKELEEEFIKQLQTLPELWDAQNDFYADKYTRLVGYKKLLGVLKKVMPHATVDHVRKKINSLKSNYRRELKKKCANKSYTPKSKSFKLLSFLKDIEEPKCSQQIQHKTEITKDSGSSQEYVNELINPVQNKSYSSIKVVVDPSKNIYDQNELMDQANLSLSYRTLQSQQSMPGTKTSHSLALIWAEKLDNLHPQQRLFAEKAINDVLFEAALGNLNRYSVKINEADRNVSSASVRCKVSPLNSVTNSPTPSDM